MNCRKTFGIKILRLSQLAKAVSSDYNDSREKVRRYAYESI